MSRNTDKIVSSSNTILSKKQLRGTISSPRAGEKTRISNNHFDSDESINDYRNRKQTLQVKSSLQTIAKKTYTRSFTIEKQQSNSKTLAVQKVGIYKNNRLTFTSSEA